MLASIDRRKASRARGRTPLVPPDLGHVKRGPPNLTEAIILIFFLNITYFYKIYELNTVLILVSFCSADISGHKQTMFTEIHRDEQKL